MEGAWQIRRAENVGAAEAGLHEVGSVDDRARGQPREREELEPARVRGGHAAIDPRRVGRAEDELLRAVAVGVDDSEAPRRWGLFILSLLHNLSSFLPSVSVNIVC